MDELAAPVPREVCDERHKHDETNVGKLNGLCLDMAALKGAMRAGFVALAILGGVGTAASVYQAFKPTAPVTVQMVPAAAQSRAP